MHFLVKWVGYDDPKDYTWEPLQNLTNCSRIIESYMEELKQSNKKKNSDLIETNFIDSQIYPDLIIKQEKKDRSLFLEGSHNPFKFKKYLTKKFDEKFKILEIFKKEEIIFIKFNSSNGEFILPYDEAIFLIPNSIIQFFSIKLDSFIFNNK